MEIPIVINYLVSLFMLCSPLAAIPIFLSMTSGKASRQRAAIWIGVIVGLILAVTAWIGSALLKVLGIRLPAFQCAGGIIVFLLALSMLQAKVSPIRQTEEEEEAIEKSKAMIPIVPLAIPVMIGPGSLSGVIVMAHVYHTITDLFTLSLCGLVIGALITLTLFFGAQLEKKIGASGINVVTRIGGLILSALAIEIFAKGIEGLFLS